MDFRCPSQLPTLEGHPAAEDDVGIGRGLAGSDDELGPGDHTLEFFVGDERQVRQPGLEEFVGGRVLGLYLFGSDSALDHQLFEQTGEHGLEGGDAEPEGQVHDRGAGWYRQPRVADHDEVRVPQPPQRAREVRVDDPRAFQSASTTSGVGSAPWAPSFVTAAAPARTA